MISRLYINNFKGFKEFTIDFETISLLVGANNSGKTTIFHALQTFFWCIDRTANINNGQVKLGKTQIPEIGAFPYFDAKDIFYHQKIREGKKPRRIVITCKFNNIVEFGFDIYAAFSRNLIIDGHNFSIPEDDFNIIIKENKPVFIPSTIGITAKEELFRQISQERLISEGRHNEVIRNQIYRLQKNPGSWREFEGLINQIFKINGINIPFNENTDEWLSVIYNENDYSLDCISAGSGFLQLINILVFIFLNESKIALLDEPDSHMHADLQQVFFELLQRMSNSKRIQIIIASHSPTLIDSASLNNIFVIDKSENFPLKAEQIEELIPLLNNQGIYLPHTQIIDLINSRKAIFIENIDADYDKFLKPFGKIIDSGFLTKTRNIIPISSGGATKTNFRETVAMFESLIGVTIRYIYLIDRDFQTDNQLSELQKAYESGSNFNHIWVRRNRESYLCEPSIISRLLNKRWINKNPGQEIPMAFNEESINNFFIDLAKDDEERVRSSLLMQQEPYIRGDREKRTLEINNFFADNYTKERQANKIPYIFFNSKDSLSKLRRFISETYSISFSDREIIEEFKPEEITEEIKIIVSEIIKLGV